MNILLHLAAAALYVLLGVHFWRALKAGRAADGKAVERIACLVPIVLHAVVLYQSLFREGGLHFGLGVALSLMCWLAVLVYWLESWWTRLPALQMVVMPLAALAVLSPLALPASHEVTAHSRLFAAHFLVAMLATLAALHAVLMAVVEKRLHEGRFTRLLEGVPPLLTMETLLFRLLGVAFALLTLTVGSGVLFSEEVFGRALHFDHKTVFAIASWVIFGVLLVGRRLRGWRGRTALRWTLAGFVMLLLAYVGTQFVLSVILGRP
jgi:ABC-type uncharacterized transport system permease subunit